MGEAPEVAGSFDNIEQAARRLRAEGFEDLLVPADTTKPEVFEFAVQKFERNGYEVRTTDDSFEFERGKTKRRIFVRKP